MVLWLHMIGCLIGAAGLGALLGTLGAAIPWRNLPVNRTIMGLVITGFTGLLYSVHELRLADIPAPQCHRQVPRKWSYLFSPKVSSLFYGLGLGFALTTRIPVSTFYAVVLWAVLIGDPLISAFGLAAFGFGRALPLLLLGCSFSNDEEYFRLTDALHCWKPVVHLMNGLILAAVGSCLVTTSLILSG